MRLPWVSAFQELGFELGVLSDIAGEHLLDLAGFKEQAQAEVVDSGVIAGDSEVLYAAVAQGKDEGFRNAAESEAADGEQHPVVEQASEGGVCVGVNFIHRGGFEWSGKSF